MATRVDPSPGFVEAVCGAAVGTGPDGRSAWWARGTGWGGWVAATAAAAAVVVLALGPMFAKKDSPEVADGKVPEAAAALADHPGLEALVRMEVVLENLPTDPELAACDPEVLEIALAEDPLGFSDDQVLALMLR